ncbi:MAG: Gfo/Idh/MocA family oxidoreductase [Clostridia bacterium]|nr:Gfo/Idh/MocA family oxidoreductase [Clostridia bacterium]
MKTVITYGVFDLYHEGHESLLKRAKELGDRLIVGVTTDQYAAQRGKLTLVDPIEKRMEHVRSCPYVDAVIVEDRDGQKVDDIKAYGVDVFAIGDDWFGKFDHLKALCEVVYLKRTPGISSSLLKHGAIDEMRIGIVGSGRIAERFCREAGFVRDVSIESVYHPRPDTSASLAAFRSAHPGIMLARTTEKLFDQTDAVYIASPHETHYGYVKQALLAGRHVLVEKPAALKREEAEELFAIAKERNLVLMEAVKTAYCPGFLNLVSLVQSGEIGEVVDITAAFSRLTSRGLREWTDTRCGGSFTEFGSYLLLPVMKLFGTEGLSCSFRSVTDSTGIDLFTVATVMKGEKTATLRCGIGAKTEGELIIAGTKGYLIAEAPWWKTSYFEIRYEDPHRRKRFSFPYEGDGLRYEIADLLYRARGYSGRDYKLLPEDSVTMAGIMETFLSGQRKERYDV